MFGAAAGCTMHEFSVVALFVLLTALAGVCPQRPKEVFVREGELVALLCPHKISDGGDAKLVWTGHTTQDTQDLNNMSSVDWSQKGVLVDGRSLVILNASVNHQGNYSCSLGNESKRFRMSIQTTQQYEQTCNTEESCTLACPEVNVPDVKIQNITVNGSSWQKEGESSPREGYYSSVAESDHGVYTCTRFYLHQGQRYHRTFTLVLIVQPKKDLKKSAAITSPRSSVILVDLGSTVVVDCKTVMYSEFGEVYWFAGDLFVERNDSLSVFYNSTSESNGEEIKMTTSLVFKKVSKEDLSRNYTCKMDTENQPSSSVTITLAQKPASSPSYVSLALGVVCAVLLMVLMAVIYVKFKMSITLFLRDTLGCHCSASDGKSYDAFLMSYKSDTGAGLNERDRKWLETVLEERFGYTLCLYDRDVLPGKEIAEAVLDCMEQSRAVLLVPTSSDSCPGSGLLSAVHAALVERQTRLVFIKPEAAEVSRAGSLPEALQLLGDCATWKGSMSTSASFWKQLRYYLPHPQRAPKLRLLPQTKYDVTSW